MIYSCRLPLFLLIFFLSQTSLLPEAALGAEPEKQPAQRPQRIISLGPINTENVYLLGAEDQLVGNTTYCMHPAAAVQKVKVGTVMQVSMEKILALQPDLILATNLTRQKQIRQMRTLGLRVVQFTQPASFSEICAHFLDLAKVLGLEQRGQKIIAEVQQQVQEIGKRYAHLPRQKVLLQIGSQPLFVATPLSFTHDYIRLSHGLNIIGERRRGNIHYEEIFAKDPDLIIIAIMGSEKGVAALEKKKWLQYTSLSAVRQGRVHIINPDLVCSPSPRSFVEALGRIAHLIYPPQPPSI